MNNSDDEQPTKKNTTCTSATKKRTGTFTSFLSRIKRSHTDLQDRVTSDENMSQFTYIDEEEQRENEAGTNQAQYYTADDGTRVEAEESNDEGDAPLAPPAAPEGDDHYD